MKMEKPTYTTSQAEGIFPVFISTSIFNGQTYTGGPAKNKKEAEQRAARAVIESILGLCYYVLWINLLGLLVTKPFLI